MFDIFVGSLLGASLLVNLWQLTRWSHIKEAIQEGLDKAERTRNGYVKLPVNEVMRWGFSTRHGIYSLPDRPWRDPRELRSKPGPHPATLSPARRSKL